MDPNLPPDEARRTALTALWTFPSLLTSAFVLAWGAESAQFFVSQGLALAVLAWLQVMPEFAVEAVIAWHGNFALMTANFTGALRLLTGLGWPTIWIVFATAHRARGNPEPWPQIELDEEHAAEVIGLVPPLLYFIWIIVKGTLDCVDAGVLLAMYLGYLIFLNRLPSREHEEMEDVTGVPRHVLRLPPLWRALAIVGLFVGGGFMLFSTASPFLNSMLGIATITGISQFVFVQWVAPFLSEFPEFVTTAYWARGRGRAGMALMNMASSNINQWTILAAMIPIVYSMSVGHIASVPMAEHRVELLLTLLQGMLGVVLLANFNFQAYEAAVLLVLWFAQFLRPDWREECCFVYGGWLAFELISSFWRKDRLRAFVVFPQLWNLAARRRSMRG
jgi:cation:H+ antiporter